MNSWGILPVIGNMPLQMKNAFGGLINTLGTAEERI